MKVLLINEVCGTGSTGRICTDLATELDRQGHEVKIAYGRDGNVPEQYRKYAVRIGNDLDVRCHALLTRAFDMSGFGSRLATEKFIRWVKEYNPDIIHLHNLHGYYINIEVLFDYLKSCGKKIIWTLHDCWAYTGHSAYCDVVKCERWKQGCYKCPQLRTYPKSFYDRSKKNWKIKKEVFSNIKNMTIVCPSEWLASQVRESFLGQYPIKVIYNGIDTSVFHKIHSNYKEENNLRDKLLILSVATMWNNLKGYADFIELSKMLPKDYVLLLVGGMDEKLRLNLPNNIIYINRTHNIKEMSDLYNAADVYLNLTYCDTYPTVNLEAIACGTPVITYDVGGSSEIVKKYGGVVVPRGEIQKVIETLMRVKKLQIDSQDICELDKQYAINQYLKMYGSDR